MAKTIIEFEAFMGAAILPAGYRFHEWVPGYTVVPAPAPASTHGVQTYFDRTLAAIEGPDGKYASFEIVQLARTPEMKRGIIYIGVAELAQAVDKAIEQLEATET